MSSRTRSTNTAEHFQVPLLSLLPDETPLDPAIARPGDSDWEALLSVFSTSKAFGFDLETYGLDHPDHGLDPRLGSIRLINVGLLNGRVLQVDLGGRDGCTGCPKALYSGFLFVLKQKLVCPATQVVGHNLKFDAGFMFEKFSVQIRCARDTQLMSQIYWAGIKQYRHNLKAVCDRLSFSDVDKEEQKSDWSWTLTNSQRNYAAKDASVVLDIWLKLGALLHVDDLSGPALAECGALPAFLQMERFGMPVNWDILQSTLGAYRAIENQVLASFSRAYPDINPDSSKQVLAALQLSGVPVESTDQAALADYWDKPEIRSLSLWRSLRQYITYLENLETNYRDGFVCSNYRQIGPTGFGRSTSSNPNLQNPPRHFTMPDELKAYNLPPVRGVFQSPKGYKLIIGDLSQAHARIATEASQDKTLLAVYRDGLDMHCVTASKLAKQQGKDWSPEEINAWRKDKNHENQALCASLRQLAKPVFYGSLNQQGPRTLANTVKTDSGVELSVEESRKALDAWQEAYSGLFNYQHRVHAEGDASVVKIKDKNFGIVKGLSKRRIYLPQWPNDYGRRPSIKGTDSVSFVWSSTEADVIKLAMGEPGILGEIDAHPEWCAHVANMCHDEIDLLVREEYALDVATALQKSMQGAMGVFIKSIPVDEENAQPEDMIATSWNDK